MGQGHPGTGIESEAERLRSLQDLDVLGSERSETLDRLCALARELFDVPLAMLTLLDDEWQWIRAASGSFPACSPRTDSFCTHTISANAPLVIEDATRHPSFRDNPHVVAGRVRFYAGVPVETEPGLPLGAFCIVDTQPRSLSPDRLAQLTTLADLAATDLRLRATALRLATEERRYRALVDAGATLVWRMTPTGDLTEITMQQALSEEDASACKGRGYRRIVHPDDLPGVDAALGRCLEGGHGGEWHARLRVITGAYRWFQVRCVPVEGRGARIEEFIGSCTDVHDRKVAEEAAWDAAHCDALTGLANRALFHRRLEAVLAEADATGGEAHLLIVDLDDFKDVNDTLGHQSGDDLLRAVGERLREVVGDSGTVGRFGGDEFGVILAASDAPAGVANLAARILDGIQLPVRIGEGSIRCRASIGTATYGRDGTSPAELFKAADLAMYAAKGLGRNRACAFVPAMREAMEERVQVAAQIRTALAEDRIVPYYQPKVCLVTGRITGFEALARWKHPRRGVLGPASFASALADPELSLAIGARMIGQVLTDLAAWMRLGHDLGRVAVNLSTAQFTRADFAEWFVDEARRHGVPLANLEVEVTETVFLDRSNDNVDRILSRLHQAGVSVALDDFGTGFASLTHLKQFPVDRIKIDRSFVNDIERDPEDAAIVSAITGLGKSLGIAIVAEGIETPGQAEFLQGRGCEEGQGYLYARPMPAERVPALLAGWRAGAAAIAGRHDRDGPEAA